MPTTVLDNDTVPVAALVVGFAPDLPALNALLRRLLQEVRLVVLLNNGGAEGFLQDCHSERDKVCHIAMGRNYGLGAALNRGMHVARAAGLRYVVTFDQDSVPPLGMVKALYAAMQIKLRDGVPCAAVGPCFYDWRDVGEQCFPIYKEARGRITALQVQDLDGVPEVDVLITSGMLVDSDVWDAGLKYDEQLFIDYTDTDWCFRARAAGKRLFVLPTLRMPHALSSGPPVRLFGIHLLRYPPLRRYYYFRNTAYFVRQSYVSNAWRRRLVGGLVVRMVCNPLIDEDGLRGISMCLKGLWHGLNGRMGEYES